MTSRKFSVFAPYFCGLLNRSTMPMLTSGLNKVRHTSNVYPIYSSKWISRRFCSAQPNLQKQTVSINFLVPDGQKVSVDAKIGDNLLDVIIDNDLDFDGFGACEGTLACSTCHLVFKDADYENVPEKPTDEELDMLDLAYGLTDTSRLGCQVIVTRAMEGWEINVPQGVEDAREP